MGMAASQGRFLQLTARKNSIGYQLSMLSNSKMSLTRDMQKVSKEYQNALSQKTMKWTNNSGVSYTNISYQNLMKPNAMNQYKPYILTDRNDRVVLDPSYEKYAQLISPTGTAGGNWENVRTQVISELTGIDATKIEQDGQYDVTLIENNEEIAELLKNEPKPNKNVLKNDTAELLKKLGNYELSLTRTIEWASDYNTNETHKIGNHDKADDKLTEIMDQIANTLSPYFVGQEEEFKEAVNNVKNQYVSLIQNKTDLSKSSGGVSGKKSNYKINVKTLITEILSAYGENGGKKYEGPNLSGTTEYVWYDINSPDYATWKTEHAEWEEAYNQALQKNHEDSLNNSQLLTANETSLIKFYDAVFSTIAEKGWVLNEQVQNEQYLNQMLQNNIYTITTVDRSSEYDEFNNRVWNNEYETNLAGNYEKIVTVNDDDIVEEALAEYKYKKSIINTKETRIDTRMKDLETEQAAINQMLQGLQKTINDNSERTMKWCG